MVCLTALSNIGISSSPSGVNAEAISIITTTGIVTSTRYINAGAGYTISPSIQIGGSVGITTGLYKFNEVVVGSISSTWAYVKNWDYSTRVLKVSIINGQFSEGEIIVGAGASYKVYSVESDDLYDKFASNKEIQQEADSILDFSVKNPFGEF
jgi:hypothetical protein